MKRLLLTLNLALFASACSDSNGGSTTNGTDGGGTPDSAAQDGSSQADTSTPPPGDGAAGTCTPSSPVATPVECEATWSLVLTKSHAGCLPNPGGGPYLAHCGAGYDALIAAKPSGTIYCFYDTGTGNLTGTVSGTRCLSLDPGFTTAPTDTCAPVGAADCPDGG